MSAPERLWQALCLALADAAGKGGFGGVMTDPAEGAAAGLLAEAARAAGLRPIDMEGIIPPEPSPERDAALARKAVANGALLLNAADATALAVGEGGRVGHLTPLHDLWRGEVAALATARGLPPPVAVAETEAILHGLLEAEKPVDALVAEGYDRAEVLRLWRMVAAAAYKRRQAPLGLRLGRGHSDPFSNGMTGLLP